MPRWPVRTMSERFWSKVHKTDGCWLWTAARKPNGYGIFSQTTPTVRHYNVHRLAYELAVGPIPDGMQVCHHCDVRHCVNPAHLFLGTQKDNIADMWAKGRAGGQFPRTQGDRCKRGHLFTPENTYRPPHSPSKTCRTCMREHQRRFAAAHPERQSPRPRERERLRQERAGT